MPACKEKRFVLKWAAFPFLNAPLLITTDETRCLSDVQMWITPKIL